MYSNRPQKQTQAFVKVHNRSSLKTLNVKRDPLHMAYFIAQVYYIHLCYFIHSQKWQKKYTFKLITLANGERGETDHGQWWSILLMQRWQTLQWWARGGRYVSQRLHTVQPSQPWSEPTQWLRQVTEKMHCEIRHNHVNRIYTLCTLNKVCEQAERATMKSITTA